MRHLPLPPKLCVSLTVVTLISSLLLLSPLLQPTTMPRDTSGPLLLATSTVLPFSILPTLPILPVLSPFLRFPSSAQLSPSLLLPSSSWPASPLSLPAHYNSLGRITHL